MPRIRVDGVEPDISQMEKPKEVVLEKPTEVKPAGIIEGVKNLINKELFSKSGTSLFSAFSVCPPGVNFGESGDNEEILLLLRAHIITNGPWVAISLLMLIVPLILIPLLSGLGNFGIGAGSGLVFILFWYAGTFTYAFLNFLYWYFNVYIVTNERIIDIDWYSVVVRKVSSAQIGKIQDVSATHVGVLSGIFDYGNVYIQTAGEENNFEFTSVPYPQLVAKQINELVETAEEKMEHHPGT